MTAELEQLSKRPLSSILGVNASGLAGLQGINRVRNLVALYGDSLVASSTLDAQWRRAAKSEINIANNLTGQRMIFVRRRAVSGERSDQILQRFLADVADGSLVASGAGTVIFTMGTNDIGSGGYTDVVSGATITLAAAPANVVANAARLVDTCTALGIQCIFRTVHGTTSYSSAQIAAMAETNRLIIALAKGRSLHVFETRDLLRDPLTTTASALTFRSGLLYDAAHPGVAGAYALGKRLAEIVRAIIPPLPQSYSDGTDIYSANLPAELLGNPTFTGTGGTLGAGGTLGTNAAGGALAGVPTGWVAQRAGSTATFTINVGEDSTSRYVEFVITETTAGGGVFFHHVPTSGGTKVSPGESLQGFSTIEVVSGAVNLACACPWLDMSATVEGVQTSYLSSGAFSTGMTDGTYPSTEGFIFEDATEPLVVPNFTIVQWITCRALEVRFAGAGSATVRVRKPRFGKVAATQPIAA